MPTTQAYAVRSTVQAAYCTAADNASFTAQGLPIRAGTIIIDSSVTPNNVLGIADGSGGIIPGGAPAASIAFGTRTMLPSDWNQQLECSSGSGVTLTIDATSIAGVLANSIVALTQAGAGALTVTGSGVTIRGSTTIAQYGTIALQLKANGEVWVV